MLFGKSRRSHNINQFYPMCRSAVAFSRLLAIKCIAFCLFQLAHGVCAPARPRSNIKANEARILSFIRQAEQLMSMRHGTHHKTYCNWLTAERLCWLCRTRHHIAQRHRFAMRDCVCKTMCKILMKRKKCILEIYTTRDARMIFDSAVW